MARDTTTYVMPCATAAESQALRRRAAAAQARYAAPAPAQSRPVTTMADGARLRPVAPGADLARQQWAARQADMDATARRWQMAREHRAGIDLAYRMRLI